MVEGCVLANAIRTPKCAKRCFWEFPRHRVGSVVVRITGMTNEQGQTAPLLTYVEWRVQLRKDCEIQGKLPAFDSLGEYTLKLLWKNGLGPTVRDIVGSIDGQSELNTAQESDGRALQSASDETKP